MKRVVDIIFVLSLFMATSRAADVDFEKDIKPIFRARCASCHGPVKQESGLRLDAGTLVLKGGSAPVIEPGQSKKSELVVRVLSEEESERMPPEGARLTKAQVDLIRSWIDEGAKIPQTRSDHWNSRGALVIPARPAAGRTRRS